MAGESTSPSGSGRSARISRVQPATAPGTVTEWMPVCGIVVMPRASEPSIVSAGRRPAAGVDAVQRSGCGVVDDREQIAADAVHHRRDDAHHRVGGDGRVDGVAAAREHDAPACDASGCSLATMPPVDITIDRACVRSMAVRT